jgi:DNA-binding GntR family transcriptional regulator
MGRKVAVSENMPKRSPAKTLAEQAYELLEEKIICLDLAPGSLLSEAVLVNELHIGRTPIREALQKLAQAGLVVILPHKGILVSEINPLKQLKLIELRQVLEQLMVRSAAVRSTKEQRDHFLAIADCLEKASSENDAIEFMRYDNLLHILIAQATNNEYLCRAMELFNSLSRRFWYMHNKESADMPYCSDLHADLARQIASGDAEKAVEAHRKLIDYLVTVTQSTLSL